MNNIPNYSNVSATAPIYSRLEAKKRLTYLLMTDLNYDFKENWITTSKLHMIFPIEEGKYNLQMIIDFFNDRCEVLTFINPTALTKEYYEETLKAVGLINSYIKNSEGKFLIDDSFDICYSLELSTSMIEYTPVAAIYEIHGAVYYFEDVFKLLIDVASGNKTYEDCVDFIDKIRNP